jgi:HEAT repeat protein
LHGLKSLNGFLVRTSAFSLARLHDPSAVNPIIEACNSRPREERSLTANALLYFKQQHAQRAADSILVDAAFAGRWRMEVKRRGWRSAMRDRAVP